MAMDAGEIERLIKAALPDAHVRDRGSARRRRPLRRPVISAAFKGKTRVQQHQMVYQALQGRMGGELHALALQTSAPAGLSEFLSEEIDPWPTRSSSTASSSDITDNAGVLYMKGTPVFPQCGFSAAVVQILTHLGVKFKGVDVLDRPRDSARASRNSRNWPTIPQLYVKGEFVGGCDIVREMFESGELQEYLQDHGIAKA